MVVYLCVTLILDTYWDILFIKQLAVLNLIINNVWVAQGFLESMLKCVLLVWWALEKQKGWGQGLQERTLWKESPCPHPHLWTSKNMARGSQDQNSYLHKDKSINKEMVKSSWDHQFFFLNACCVPSSVLSVGVTYTFLTFRRGQYHVHEANESWDSKLNVMLLLFSH